MSSIKTNVSPGKVVLSGFLDENSDLKALHSLTGPVSINFKGVTRVNSCGVREWVNLLAKIPGAQLSYEDCPIVVVKQLNAVPDFVGAAKVTTFQAPYFCEKCDEESVQTLQGSQVQGQAAPPVKCPTCSTPMNFDAIPGQYFSFIKRGKPAGAKAA